MINLSLSVACDCPDVRDAVAAAIAAKISVVAASGNDGLTHYPAAYPGVISADGWLDPLPVHMEGETVIDLDQPTSSGAAADVSGLVVELRAINPAIDPLAVLLATRSPEHWLDRPAAVAMARQTTGYAVYVPAVAR